MKIIIEDKDYIEATTPFLNGCSFSIIVRRNKFYIEPGCCCYYNMLRGAKYEIYKRWEDNGRRPYNIQASPELKIELLKPPSCKICGGLKHYIG